MEVAVAVEMHIAAAAGDPVVAAILSPYEPTTS